MINEEASKILRLHAPSNYKTFTPVTDYDKFLVAIGYGADALQMQTKLKEWIETYSKYSKNEPHDFSITVGQLVDILKEFEVEE